MIRNFVILNFVPIPYLGGFLPRMEMNLGSSELSASCLLSWRSLLASLAMCVVASTMRAACRVAIASSHRSVAARIAATERPENLIKGLICTKVGDDLYLVIFNL